MNHNPAQHGWLRRSRVFVALGAVVLIGSLSVSLADQPPSSYAPVVVTEDFQAVMARMSAAKAEVMKRQMDLLQERYDLSNRPSKGVTMSRGKPIQAGVRVKLTRGTSWDKLNQMTPVEIRNRD